MDIYEYRVVPAPTRALRWRGIRGAKSRFAHTIEHVINDFSADGWEYLRADTLPMEKRRLLSTSETVLQNVLVFRRLKDDAVENAPAAVEPHVPVAAKAAAEVDAHPDPTLMETVEAYEVAEPVAPANSPTAPDLPEDNDAFRKAIASIALGGAKEERFASEVDRTSEPAVAGVETPVVAAATQVEGPIAHVEVSEVAEQPAAVPDLPAEPAAPVERARTPRVNPALAARAARLTANRTAAE